MSEIEAAVGRAWSLRVEDTPMPAPQLARLVLSAMGWCIQRASDPDAPLSLALINCFGQGMAGPLPEPLHPLLPRLRHLSLSRHIQLPPGIRLPALVSLVVTNVASPCRGGLPALLDACPTVALLSVGGVDERAGASRAASDDHELLGAGGAGAVTDAIDAHAALTVLEITFSPAAAPLRSAAARARTRHVVRTDVSGPAREGAHAFDDPLLPPVAQVAGADAMPRPLAVWDFMDAGSLAVPPLPAAAAARVQGFAGDAAACADSSRQSPLHHYTRGGREGEAVSLVKLGCPVHPRDKRRACAAAHQRDTAHL